jgi:hypothetical protein
LNLAASRPDFRSGKAKAEGQKMSQDKRQALDDMLAGVFRELPPDSANTETSPPVSIDEEPADQDKLQALDSMLVEVLREPSVISTKTESSAATFSDQPSNEVLADQIPVDVPPDAGNPSIQAVQAKSLLAGLDLDTAIRLRWALRDIKAKRTKLTPVSPSDLRSLIEMGLVEMCNDAPMLTNEGHREIA